MGSMLGLVLSDDVITLFVFWELTSVTSFLLIGFNHESPRSRRAAVQALVVTGGGGLALLAGLLLMAQVGGSMELSTLLSGDDVLRNHPMYLTILILVLAAAFTKSAQVPFSFWLPNAMEAPTPVSAYLHSATMVKAGVYLLARVNPGLGGTDVWQVTLVVFGAATFLTGAVLALRNTDLKLMLAQTTVASLGLMVFLIGLGHEIALQAAMIYLFAHSLFKGALFMAAGCIDHGTGTREIGRLSGLGRAMPVTAAASVLAALSMAGLAPFIGFIAKEFAYKGDPGRYLAAGNHQRCRDRQCLAVCGGFSGRRKTVSRQTKRDAEACPRGNPIPVARAGCPVGHRTAGRIFQRPNRDTVRQTCCIGGVRRADGGRPLSLGRLHGAVVPQPRDGGAGRGDFLARNGLAGIPGAHAG